MSKDRIIQIVAFAFAVFAVLGAGRILPTIVEKAGQEHLVLTTVDPTTTPRPRPERFAPVHGGSFSIQRTNPPSRSMHTRCVREATKSLPAPAPIT